MSEQLLASDGWALLASAIAGRPLAVAFVEGGLAYTDGETIFAPRDGDLDSIVVQAALLAAGSFEVPVTRLVGRRGTRGRYLTLEARRAAGVVAGIAPRGVLRRIDSLHDGSISASAEESLDRAASTRIPDAPRWCGEIRPTQLMRARTAPSGDVTDAMVAKALGRDGDLDELDDDDANDSDRSRLLDLISAPISSPMAAKLARMLGMGGAPSGADSGAGDDNAMRGNRSGSGRAGAHAATNAPVSTSPTRRAAAIGCTYPEWVAEKRTYRPDWCTVAAFEPAAALTTEPLEDDPDPRLRKRLAQLGLADEPHRRQADGDALDITALIDYAADRRSGGAGTPRVYEQRRRTGHDLGVVVILDASGSTGESADGRQIFAGERQLAARLTSELEALGNRVATYGFYSLGKDNIRFLRVKTFDEQYGYAARRRLAAIEPTGFTRLGAAIRHGTRVVREDAGTSKHLLVVIGDGLPYEDGYEHHQAYGDTRKALDEAVAEGVGCVCVAMRSSTQPEVIQRVWGHVAHCHVSDPDELAGEIQPLLRRALKDAAAQRRRVASNEEVAA